MQNFLRGFELSGIYYTRSHQRLSDDINISNENLSFQESQILINDCQMIPPLNEKFSETPTPKLLHELNFLKFSNYISMFLQPSWFLSVF